MSNSKKTVIAFTLLAALMSGCSKQSQADQDARWRAMCDSNQYRQVTREAEAALRDDSKNETAQYWLAVVDLHDNNEEDALEKTNTIISKNPRNAHALSLRSLLLSNQGQNDDALSDANKAIQYDPTFALAYHRRGIIYDRQKKYEEALADFDKAVQVASKPTPSELYYLSLSKGRCYVRLGQYPAAIKEFDKAVSQLSSEESAYAYRAQCYALAGDWKNAERDCTKFRKLLPHSNAGKALGAAILSAHQQRALGRAAFCDMAKKLKKPLSKGALRRICTVVDFGPNYPCIADFCYGSLDAGNPKMALGIITEVNRTRPLEPEEECAWAQAELASGYKDKAVKLLTACLANNPTLSAPRIALIKIYTKDGLRAKAKALQSEGLALKLSPEDKRALAGAL